MGRIVISTNATLDGMVQDPDGLEGASRGGWFKQLGGADLAAWQQLFLDESARSTAVLLGRKSDAWFASRWSSRTGEWADRLNGMPKYVVSSTVKAAAWQNGTVLHGDPIAAVTTLKQRVDGDILLYASYQLGRALLDHDLIDEIRLVVFPFVLGAGERLFGAVAQAKAMRLVAVRAVGESLVHLTYGR